MVKRRLIYDIVREARCSGHPLILVNVGSNPTHPLIALRRYIQYIIILEIIFPRDYSLV